MDEGARVDGGRPLEGLRVLVTRARSDSDELSRRLTDLGATARALPLIELQALDPDSGDLLADLESFDWIVFSSANAVAFFMDRMEARGLRLDTAHRVAAVGPATAGALAARGVTVHLVPGAFRAEELVSALAPHVLPGTRILVPRAKEGREVLLAGLESQGAEVIPLALYETGPREASRPELARCLADEPPDVILAASGSAVQALARLAPAPSVRRIPLACIGPVTASEAAGLGFERILVAPEASIDGLITLLEGLWKKEARILDPTRTLG